MKLLFMGRKKYAAKALEWSVKQGIQIVGVVLDNPDGETPVKIVADSLHLPIISKSEAEEALKKDEEFTDLVVSYLFSKRICEPLISKPKFGAINFHPAILPNWRGTAGYNIAILQKLSEWGASAHYMDEEIDTGAIIKVKKFKFNHENETAYSLEKKTQKKQLELYKEVISEVLKKGRLECYKQLSEDGIYINRAQMEAMKEIDICNDDIDNKIRAFWFPPYTGAYIKINNKRYTLINDDILRNLADKKEY